MKKLSVLSLLMCVGSLALAGCGSGGGGKKTTTGGATTSDSGSTGTSGESRTSGTSSSSGGGGGENVGPAVFWHNFGAGYTIDVNEAFINPLKEQGLVIEAEGKKGYDNLLKEIVNSVAASQYPNMATGYPDHFAMYSRMGYPRNLTGILVDLNKYLNDENSALNIAHKEKYGRLIKDDYYPEYMVENQTIAYDENDNPYTVGLPFNKATEVMCYNGVFFDYAKSLHPEVKVPETWAEWATYGPVFREIQLDLIDHHYFLTYELGSDGYATNFATVTAKPAETVKYLDFTEITDRTKSSVLSWDSEANMFITLVRQFGAQFTSYTAADRHDESIPIQKRHGYVEFLSGDNKQKTIDAMQMVLDLAGDGTDMNTQIFAPSSAFGTYSSGAFAMNAVLFAICSTGGLSYNINANQEFRVAPIPYLSADKKFVISQGANITVFDQGYIGSVAGKSGTPEEMADKCFNAIVKMTTGDYQAKFASLTGYFPASKSATESVIYQNFLNGIETDPIKKAYRDGARVNNDEYMAANKGWTKFVDPGFLGSSEIRSNVNTLITALVSNHTKTEFNLEAFLNNAYFDLFSDYIRD